MKKLLLFLLLCSPLQAAVTFDAVSNSVTTATNATTTTWNHTVGSGCSSALLIVSVSIQDGTVEAETSVTYNGVSMGTPLIAGDTDGQFRYALYYAKDAALVTAGKGIARAVLVTYPVVKNQILGTARSYCGVHQTTTFGTAVENSGAGTGTGSITVTSATGELVVDMAAIDYRYASVTVVAGQTNSTVLFATGNHFHATSDKTGAAPNVTTSWTLGTPGGYFWSMLGVSLKPSAAAASTGPILLSHRRRRSQ